MDLTYSTNPAIYTENVAITANNPSSSGLPVVSYAITPTLPTGLLFNPNAGIISGTPTVASPGTAYTVTATNAYGSATATVVIAVSDATCTWDYSVHCPDTEICAPSGVCVTPLYADNGDGTVTEAVTGLVWEQNVPNQGYTWSSATPPASGSAQAYCDGLSLSGTGWGVPSIQQLFSLVMMGAEPTIDQTMFPETGEDPFWSSTPDGSTAAWYVAFTIGDTDGYVITDGGSVRCVR